MKKACRFCSWGYGFKLIPGGARGYCGRFENEYGNIRIMAENFCEDFKPCVFVEGFFRPVKQGAFIRYEAINQGGK